MKKRICALILALAMVLGLLAACLEPAAVDQPEPSFIETETWPDENLPAENPPQPPTTGPAMSGEAEAAILRFSQTLFREVLALEEENPVISPLSAYYVLAMAALGAGGETLAEFSALLGREPGELAADLNHLTRRLTDTAGSTILQIAGSVWTAEDFAVNPTFQQAMADYFDAQAQSRDFAAPETLEEINAWVAQQTEGLIDQMLSDIGRDAVMLLINTLYLSAKWAEAFNPMTTHQGQFYPETGASYETTFLSTRPGTFPVAITEAYEAVMLPYDDGRLGFLLVRPTDGTPIRAFAAEHDLNEILAGLTATPDVQIRMPMLDLEYAVQLNEILQAMGLQAAFCDGADFSGISAEEEPLRISTVLQKVRMLVDEEGTEAAAVTVIEIERAGILLNMIELTFNSPYLFAVYDLQAGIPLFLGLLDNPA